ncbi:MAG: protein-glutamate O-methyltransferase CheR [Bacteroidetes bacterium]|nr:protein-glutamate O-methyltransferase CheR [Bacteroidota bacterium]
MAEPTFTALRSHIYTMTGIYFQDNKKYLLESRISKRLQMLQIESYEDYVRYILSVSGKEKEREFLFDAITINETYFFRNEPQFEIFEKTLIPELVAAGKTKIRVWSAASSTGEEAHTLAMIFLEKIKPKYPSLSIEIVGTDIAPGVLRTAAKGEYRQYSIRNISPYYLKKYFTENNGVFTVVDAARKLVRFEHLNLFDKNRMRLMSNFDVVFCCNVLIYFDQKSKIQVVSQLYDGLNKGGFLFIGYAESLHGISSAFKILNFPKAIAYKKE